MKLFLCFILLIGSASCFPFALPENPFSGLFSFGTNAFQSALNSFASVFGLPTVSLSGNATSNAITGVLPSVIGTSVNTVGQLGVKMTDKSGTIKKIKIEIEIEPEEMEPEVKIKPEVKMKPAEKSTIKRLTKQNAKQKEEKIRKKEACPSRKRKTQREVLNKQAREIIARVYDFMKLEASAEYAERLTNARWRTAYATGVSEKTVSRIIKENLLGDKPRKMDAAASAAAVNIGGKLQALNAAGSALGAATSGNLTGVVSKVSDAVGNAIQSDIVSGAVLASGAANAAGTLAQATIGGLGKIAENTGERLTEIAAAKKTLAQNLGSAITTALSGNLPGAVLTAGNAMTLNAAQDMASMQGMFV